MWDNDYDADREDARSDARAEGGGRRYYTSCGEGVCGASDCSTCRNGDDEDEVEEEDEDEEEDEEDDDDDAGRLGLASLAVRTPERPHPR